MQEAIVVEGRWIYTAVIVTYMLGMLWIGVIASKVTKTAADYWVAGRKLGTFVLAGTFGATFISSVTMMGSPSSGYRFGWSYWNVSQGTWIGPLIMVLTIHYFVRFVGYSVPDMIEARYGPKSRPISAIIVLFGSFGYTGVQIMAIGTVLNVIMGWPYNISLVIGTLIVLIYTVMGGMYAVAWTDVVQFIILLLGMFFSVLAVLKTTGGLTALNNAVANIDTSYLHPIGPYGSAYMILGMAVAFGLGNPSQPSYLARAFSAKNVGSIRIALGIGAMGNVLCMGGGLIVGLGALVLLGTGIKRVDIIYPLMVVKLFHPFFGGLIIAAIIAAIMSTADSFLLQAGTTIGRDFYQRYINIEATDNQLINISRIVITIVGIVGLFIAIMYPESLQFLGAYVFGTVAAGLFIPLYVGMFWRRATSTAAVWGMITGFIGTFIFTFKSLLPIHPIITGILISAIVFVIVTHLTPAEPERVDAFMRRIGRE